MSMRLDRGASLIRILLFVVVGISVVAGWLREPDTPRPGPGARPEARAPKSRAPESQATAPKRAASAPGVRYVDVNLPLPPIRGRTRFTEKTREAGKTYSGTAFATDTDDVWATARHVAEGCRRTVVVRDGRQIEVTRVVHDRATDLSLLYADTGGAISPASDQLLPISDPARDGFAMGYPGGREASVHLSYLARIAAGRPDDTGRERWAAAGLWQIENTGLFDEPNLAGISGGPLFDRQGGLVGIVVGGQPRRARATSIDPVNLTAFMDAADLHGAASGWRHRGIDPGNANAVRRELIETGLLALVICRT